MDSENELMPINAALPPRSVSRLAFPLFLFTVALLSCRRPTNEAGEALLLDYVRAMKVDNARDATESRMRATLDELDRKAQAAQNVVPEEFYSRYQRLIAMSRTAIIEELNDANHEQVVRYVQEITGKTPTESDLIPAAADAFFLEVSRLQIVLRK